LREPLPGLRDWRVPSLSQRLLDLPEFRAHAMVVSRVVV
jgi:hypothetical protein